MPTEKKVLVYEQGEICFSTSRVPVKCIVIRQEGDRVLVIDDPSLKNEKGDPIPTWYPSQKLRPASNEQLESGE